MNIRCDLRMWAGGFGEFAEPGALDPLEVAFGLCFAKCCQLWVCHPRSREKEEEEKDEEKEE